MRKIALSHRFQALMTLVAGLSILMGSAGLVLNHTIDTVIEREAELKARNWARYLAEGLPEIEKVVAGEALSPASRAFIESINSNGNVFRFKLFDAEGKLFLASDALDKTGSIQKNLTRQLPRSKGCVTVYRYFFLFGTADCGLRTADCGLRTRDCGRRLQFVHRRLRTVD